MIITISMSLIFSHGFELVGPGETSWRVRPGAHNVGEGRAAVSRLTGDQA